MSVRRRRLIVASCCAALLIGPLATTPAVLAQPAPAAGGAGAGSSVNDAIALFASGDRDKVVAGRQALVARLSGNPSASVLAQYAQDVATAIMPIVSGNDPHAKLNAAIAIQRIADVTGSSVLAAPIAKLIGDESPAISSFGLRASVNVLPRVLGNPVLANNDVLLPAIYEALAKHAGNEAVAVDVYAALTRLLSQPNAEQLLGQGVVQQATPRVVDALLKVMRSRVTDFGSGNVAEPGAEGQQAVGFLAKNSTWAAMTPQQQTQAISVLLALLDGSVAEMTAVPDAQTTGRPRVEAARGLLKYTAQGLGVIASLANKADLRQATDKIQNVNQGTPQGQISAMVADVAKAFATAFPDAAPATTQASTTAPTSAPAQ